MEEIKNMFDAYLQREGLRMTKQISSGGFLSYATYDVRTVYTREMLVKLCQEGFTVKNDQGNWIFNMIFTQI